VTLRRACAAAAAALLVAASPVGAQQLRFRIGGVRARYADTVSGSAGALTTRLAWDGRRATGTLDGTFTQFSSGTWAAQAAGSLFAIHLLTPSTAIGLRADGDGGYIQGGTWSAIGSMGPVLAVVTGPWFYTAGVDVGAVRRVDRLSNAVVQGSVMVRRDAGPWALQGGLAATRAGATRITDATLGVQFRLARLTLSALAGARAGNLGGRPWYQGRASLGVTSWATLEAQAGSYPRDLSGFTEGSFLSVGVWLGGGLRRRLSGLASGPPLPSSSEHGVTVESVETGRQRVTFIVPGARNVAIAGEWNDWTPVALEHLEGTRWRANLALRQGAHRFSLVVDGRRWVVPPGVASLPDDMGGRVGLLVID
jgi:hypothetical protein